MRELTKFKAQSFQGSVDSDKRVIKEVVLIEPNREATGHGMFVDQVMVDQVVELGQAGADIGFKARFDHPNACLSTMGTQLGRLRNFKSKNGKAVADLHVGKFTEHSPNGDIGAWLLAVAEEDPDQVGFSIVFTQAEPVTFEAGEGDDADSPEFAFPHARIDTFHGADVVDEGAATSSLFEEGIMGRPNYLAEQAQYWCEEHKELLAEVLTPTINDIINQNQSIMSDNKPSLLDRLKETIASYSSEEVVTPETPEVNEELEAKDAELAAKDAEIEALKADLDAKVAEFGAKSEESVTALSEAKTAIEALNAKVEELEKVSLGTTVTPVANTDTSVELSDEAKAEKAQITKEENILAWANAEYAGKTASKSIN
jgi:hypothetical protein